MNQNTSLTILILSVVGLLIYTKIAETKSIEGFIMYPQTYTVDTVNSAGTASISGNNQNQLILNKQQLLPAVYTVPGTYQSQLSPRFSNTGYGGQITYNFPEKKNLAVDPHNPMLLAKMIEKPKIKEHFKYPLESSSTNYQNKYDSLTKPYSSNPLSEKEIVSELPIQTMATSTGSEVPLVMDRFIVSNLKSYKYGQADFIRGDLPITPVLPVQDPYSLINFRPSVSVSTDLNPGALAVIGGAYNENVRDTVQLQMQSNGGLRNTFSGVPWNQNADTTLGQLQMGMNMNMNRSNNIASSQGPPYGDISVTQFP